MTRQTRGLIFGGNTSQEANYSNIQENVANYMNEFLQLTAQSNTNLVSSNQNLTINISGCSNIESISGISQTNKTVINTEQFSSQVTESDMTVQLTAALENAIKQDQAVTNELGTRAKTEEITNEENISKISTDIATKVVQENYQTILNNVSNSQSLNLNYICEGSQAGGSMVIKDLSQVNELTLMSAQYAALSTDVLASVVTDISESNAGEQTQNVVNEGLSSFVESVFGGLLNMVLLLVLPVVVIVIIIIVAVVVSKNQKKKASQEREKQWTEAQNQIAAWEQQCEQERAANPGQRCSLQDSIDNYKQYTQQLGGLVEQSAKAESQSGLSGLASLATKAAPLFGPEGMMAAKALQAVNP
jgi:uncharacterized membrane protein